MALSGSLSSQVSVTTATLVSPIAASISASASVTNLLSTAGGSTHWTGIEDALRTWVKTASGYTDAKVIWADQSGARPAGDIITLKITDVRMVGMMDEVTENTNLSRPNGKEIEMRADGIREFTCVLQAFTAGVTESFAGRAVLGRCQTALGLVSVRSALAAAGCSPFDIGPVQNVSTLSHTLFEGRAILNVRFYTRETLSDFVGYIATVNTTSYLGEPWEGDSDTIDI